MPKRSYAFFGMLVLAAMGQAGPLAAQSEEAAGEPPPEPPALTLFLDITEEVDGGESQDHFIVYWVRTMLETAGFAGVTHRPTAYDDDEHEAARLESPDDARADLILRGSSETHLLDKAIFYEKVVAYSYRTHVAVELVDPALPEDKRVIKRWTLDEDWGDGGLAQDEVSRKCLERMGYRVAALVMLHPRSKEAVPPGHAADVEGLIEQIRDELGLPEDEEEGTESGK